MTWLRTHLARVVVIALVLTAPTLAACSSHGSAYVGYDNPKAACTQIRNAIPEAAAAKVWLQDAGSYAPGDSTFDLAVKDLASGRWPSPAGLHAIASTCGISESSLQVFNPNA